MNEYLEIGELIDTLKNHKSGKGICEKRISAYHKTVLILTAVILIIFFLSLIVPLCDFYADVIYPFIADGLGAMTAKILFPVGEVLMYAGIAAVLLCLVFALLYMILKENAGFRRFCRSYYRVCLLISLVMVILYGINWYLPFKSSVLGHGKREKSEYTVDDIRMLREFFVAQINEAAEKVERDMEGGLKVAKALEDMGSEYGRLNGYYPPVKEAMCSELLDSMDIGGYTYPFTMEVTCNKYITDLYYPSLIAHEECHHKGYYKENEGVFLGCLSLMRSDDVFLKYSGYITAYGFMDNAYWDALCAELPKEQAIQVYREQPQLSDVVRSDLDLAREKAEAKINAEQTLPKEIKESAKQASDVGWDAQGKILDEDCYDGSVFLFLDYFSLQGQ